MTKKNLYEEQSRLLERLASTFETHGSQRRNTHKIHFLAKKDEIAEAWTAGWSFRQIWEVLSKSQSSEGECPEFSGSYDLFLRYCRQYVQPSPGLSAQTRAIQKAVNETTATTGFNYDGKPDLSKLY